MGSWPVRRCSCCWGADGDPGGATGLGSNESADTLTILARGRLQGLAPKGYDRICLRSHDLRRHARVLRVIEAKLVLQLTIAAVGVSHLFGQRAIDQSRLRSAPQ